MGFRTVVVFNNDHLDQIKKDPDFANTLYHAILRQNSLVDPVNIETKQATVGRVVHCSHSNVKLSLRMIDFNAYEIPE